MRWFVDGMNVIGTRPDGWWRDRDAAMLRLVDLLERWAAAEGEDVTVVFERKPDLRGVRVVTSDRWLADRASAEGATIVGAETFRDRIESS
jgi:predicted RNA-binding protein with PIN domain